MNIVPENIVSQRSASALFVFGHVHGPFVCRTYDRFIGRTLRALGLPSENNIIIDT